MTDDRARDGRPNDATPPPIADTPPRHDAIAEAGMRKYFNPALANARRPASRQPRTGQHPCAASTSLASATLPPSSTTTTTPSSASTTSRPVTRPRTARRWSAWPSAKTAPG
jgi:hypothetical protein